MCSIHNLCDMWTHQPDSGVRARYPTLVLTFTTSYCLMNMLILQNTHHQSRCNIFSFPETNIFAPKNGGFQVRNLLFQGSIFRGYVFREGTLFANPFRNTWFHSAPRRGPVDCDHQERPIESLPSTDPLPFELRVAVFKARELRIKGK